MSGDLLELARSEPSRALEKAEALLSNPAIQPAEAAALHRVRGQAHMVVGDFASASASYQRSIKFARSAGDETLATRVAISLAGAHFDSGDPDRAFHVLDEVDASAIDSMLGISFGQRAGLLVDQGRLDDALTYFERAIPFLELTGDQFHIANTHLNMGNLYLESGDLDAATTSYEQARVLYVEQGLGRNAAASLHNLARTAGRQGDLLGALDSFEKAEKQFTDSAGARSHMGADRCEVLIQAGLLDEAVQETDQLKAFAAKSEDPRQLGYAHYLASMAHALAGRSDRAMEEARSASEVFAENTSGLLSGLATLVELECLDQEEKHALTAIGLARKFAEHGHRSGEMRALAVAAYHRPVHQTSDLDTLARATTDPRSEIRQASRLGLARVHLASGDPDRSLSLLRESLADISSQVGLQSSAPVRRSMATHLEKIQALGISILHSRGTEGPIECWIDSSRLVSSAQPPLRPVSDPGLAKMVAQLRALQSIQESENDHEVSRLESEILQRVQRVGSATADPLQAATPSTSPRSASDSIIVRFYLDNGSLCRVGSTSSSERALELGPMAQLRTTMRFLGADLRQLAREPHNHLLRDRITTDAVHLRDQLLPATDNDLVICPPPPLLSFPWSILARPGQAMTITPSMHYWHRARIAPPVAGRLLTAIAGPDLEHADREVTTIAGVRPTTVLSGSGASVGATLRALAKSHTVHLACHGNHHRSNPRFSCVRLADGNLFAHDVERMHRTPAVVILTACDTGVETALAGEEAIGFGTAFLSRGTRSVIAGTSLIPDTQLLIRFADHLHRGLAAGVLPARALALARQQAAEGQSQHHQLSAFSCLGWG